MPPSIILSRRARIDINKINNYNLENTDDDTAERTFKNLKAEIEKLAKTPLIPGSPVLNLPVEYRQWTIVRKRYKVYFKRLGGTLLVLRVVSTRQQPLTNEDILEADKE